MKTRVSMVSPVEGLSVRSQCDLLSVPRGRVYYKPATEKPENVELMSIMDRHLIDHPTEGVVTMVYMLRMLGYQVGPKRIRRLFMIMGYQAIYRRKNLTRAGMREYIRPYLLRGLEISRPNQVLVIDFTYIPMRKGFMYLTSVMDVYSRKILTWGVNNSLKAIWCIEVLKSAMNRFGVPEIVNSDQGCQYTSRQWTELLEELGIRLSMDGKGRATDNTWIERFWTGLKYDYVYLNPCDDGFELFERVQNHIEYYNGRIHHTTQDTPNSRYESYVNQAA